MAGVDAPARRWQAQLKQLREDEPAAAAAGQPRELVLDAAPHVGVLGAHDDAAAARRSAGLGASGNAARHKGRGAGREGRREGRREGGSVATSCTPFLSTKLQIKRGNIGGMI